MSIQRLNLFVAKKDKLGGTATSSLKNLLFDRGQFRYSMKHICHYILSCARCRTLRLYKRTNDFYRSHMLYAAGENKLQDELDCITFLKAIR